MTQTNNPGVDEGLRRNAIAHRLSPSRAVPGAADNVILDCTDIGRLGLRGPGTIDWLQAEGIAVPESVNRALSLPCGTAVLRLGQQEALLVAAPGGNGARLREFRAAWRDSSLQAKGYDAYREEGWAWFSVSGRAAPHLMRRISMADLRPESLLSGHVAQVRALHTDVVIARLDRFGTVSYDLFFDIASAAFALQVLTETAAGLEADFSSASLPAAA